MRKKFLALRQALIPRILLVVLPTTFLGFLASGSGDLGVLLLSLVIITIVDVGANLLNNYADWRIDIINRKRLTMHDVFDRNDLLVFYLASLILLAITLFFAKINPFLLVVVLAGVLFGMQYSALLRLKDRVIINYATIAIAYGGISFLTGFFAGTSDIWLFYEWLPITIFIILVDFGYSMTKDYPDVLGDLEHSKMTLPVIFGKARAVRMQAVIIGATYLFLLLMVFSEKVHYIYLLLLISYLIAMAKLRIIHLSEDKVTHDLMHYYAQINGLIVRFIIIAIVVFLGK
ncbi:MAG: UbiA family prenyltransferase [Candidatus Micrarchaeota archaeon]